jgi:hypothetical protein
MSVFDGKPKVERKVKDPGTDPSLPLGGALSYDAVKSSTGLAGCDGADAQLIHGDRWSEILGKNTQHIANDSKITMDANHSIQVGEHQKETICGTSTETIIGPHIITNMNVYNETRLGAHTQVHGELELFDDEDGRIHYGIRQYTLYDFTFEVEAVHTEYADFHLEAKGTHAYASGIEAQATLFQFETKPLNVEEGVTQANIKALKGDIAGLQGKLGTLESKAVILAIHLGMDPNPTPGF